MFRSADLDTQVLQRNYEIWSGTLIQELIGAQEAQSEKGYEYMSKDLSYYPNEQYREKVFELAKAILDKALQDTTSSVSPSSEQADSAAEDPMEGLPFEKGDLKGLVLCIPYKQGRYVYLEQSFAKDMVDNWSDKSLTTTSHAIEVLHILSHV